ncbi:MAG TPA: hypothetical protein VGH89_08315 [Pseudonocardia sp.]
MGSSGAPVGALVAALLVVALSMAGCSGGSSGGSSSGAELPAPPSYPDRLSRTDRDLAAAFDGINRAPNQPALARAVLAAAGTVSSASQWLASGGPTPGPMATTNDALTGTLSQFANELAYLGQQISQRVICTGATAVGAISTAPSAAALRAEVDRLAHPAGGGPGYRWGEFLPPPKDQTNTRVPNGQLVVDRRGSAGGAAGNGVLEVQNDGDDDAVVALARNGSTVLEVAVRAGQSSEVNGIPDGSYDVYYLTGSDWDQVAHGFGRQCEFHRFTGPSAFNSTPVPGGISYTEQTITVRTTTSPDTAVVEPDGLPR